MWWLIHAIPSPPVPCIQGQSLGKSRLQPRDRVICMESNKLLLTGAEENTSSALLHSTEKGKIMKKVIQTFAFMSILICLFIVFSTSPGLCGDPTINAAIIMKSPFSDGMAIQTLEYHQPGALPCGLTYATTLNNPTLYMPKHKFSRRLGAAHSPGAAIIARAKYSRRGLGLKEPMVSLFNYNYKL